MLNELCNHCNVKMNEFEIVYIEASYMTQDGKVIEDLFFGGYIIPGGYDQLESDLAYILQKSGYDEYSFLYMHELMANSKNLPSLEFALGKHEYVKFDTEIIIDEIDQGNSLSEV